MKSIKNNHPLSQKMPVRSSLVDNAQADLTGWMLPSGKRLDEFAVEGGFLGQLILKPSGTSPVKLLIGKQR